MEHNHCQNISNKRNLLSTSLPLTEGSQQKRDGIYYCLTRQMKIMSDASIEESKFIQPF